MPNFTAEQLQAEYGAELVRPPLTEVASLYALVQALLGRRLPVEVSHLVCWTWWQKSRLPAGEERLSSAKELEEMYRDAVRRLALENPTGHLLGQAMRARTPPLYATDAVLKNWLARYGGQGALTNAETAGA